jgi:cephalosporin-C deacetylase-like acetyl esterase
MKSNHETLKKKTYLLVIFFSVLFSFSLISIFFNIVQLKQDFIPLDNDLSINKYEGFDILDFWEHEIERVNNTPLNINFGENHSILYTNPFMNREYILNAQEIYFDSPNWVNKSPETIRIHGYILYPNEVKTINPGCLVMHGLNADIKDVFELTIPYLEKKFIVLAYSHPGHGKSEGAEPRPENLYYEGEYNESAHFYLTLCAAIQGLRVLENFTLVDNTQIMVTGESYGGLNAMWLSAICGERISGIISYIAIGDISKNINYPSKLIFWILGKSATEIQDSYLNNQLLRFDPIYYLKSPKLPPILWQIGTNDDFFHYSCIKGTFDAVQHDNKFLQIFPNEHHGFPFFENSTKFFIDYILNNGTAPPKINISQTTKISGIIGDSLNLSVKVNLTSQISSVMVIYNMIDIVGSCWQKVYLTRVDNETWKGTLTPGLFNSNLDFYVIVNIMELDNVWFSSNILSVGIIQTNFAVLFILVLTVLISIPIILTIRNKFLRISTLKNQTYVEAKKKAIITVIMISLSEILAYLSLIVPWVIYEKGGVIFTHIYFFNNLFTWKLFIGEIASILTSLFLVIMFIFSILAFIKPIITGFFKLIYPTLVLIFTSLMPFFSGATDPEKLISNFGITFPGMGPFFMIISAVLIILIGKWESNLYLKLGLRKTKP